MKLIDLTGSTHGFLKVIERDLSYTNKVYWKCTCECGAEVSRTTSELRYRGSYQSCGCKRIQIYLDKFNDVGKRYGKLLITKRIRSDIKSKSVLYEALCDCGNSINLVAKNIRRRKSLHCGCEGRISGRLSGSDASYNKIISSYKSNASKRSLKYEISRDEAISLFKGNCFYCNTPPSTAKKLSNTHDTVLYNGIDRLDNNKGYIPGNVVSCCSKCNYIKNKYSVEEILSWVKLVYENRNLGTTLPCNS